MDFKVDMRTEVSAKTNTKEGRKERDLERLKNACSEFEAIYINEMLKTARKTIPDDGLFQKDNATKMYEEMMDMERARAMSHNSSLGIASAMYDQMSHLITDKKE